MYERSIDPAGPSLGSLRVHVRSAAGDAGGKVTTLWRLHNHQGQRWQTARTPVVMGSERAAPSSPYQVGIWALFRKRWNRFADEVCSYGISL